MTNKKSAFTLVELLVAMSIIAVLIGLSVFGISTAQRSLRDNQRRDMVKNVAAGLADYYAQNGQYPRRTNFTNIRGLFQALGVPNEGVTQIKLTGQTDANATRYCYNVTSDGYQLGAQLESGWFDLSSGSNPCDSTAELW